MNNSGSSTAAAGIFAAFGLGVILMALLIGIAISALIYWKVFTKAGKPGWPAIIPIYNFIVLLQIAGKPVWWIILFIIPCVSVVMWVLLCLAVARSFGKEVPFAIGLMILPIIFFPILGFGSSTYVGPGGSAAS